MSFPHLRIGDTAPGEHRNLLGWIFFFGLAVFMVMMQLASYFGRTPSEGVSRAVVEQQLRTAIAMESMPASTVDPHETLNKAARDLRAASLTDPDSAVLYAAISYEAGQPVNATELAVLRYLKDPYFHAAYWIYSHDRLKPDDAKVIAASFKTETFTRKLVAAHALKKAGMPAAREALGKENGLAGKIAFVLLFGLFVFLGLGLVFAYAIARASGRLEPLGTALGNLGLPDADRVAMRSAQILIAFLGLSTILAVILKRTPIKDYVQVPVYLIVVRTVVMLSRVPVDGKWIPLRSLGVTTENLGKNIAWGIAGAIANLPLVVIVQLISSKVFAGLPPPEHPVTVELSGNTSFLVLVQVGLTAAVFAPFLEEVMFRGTLFPALAAVLRKPLVAGIVSSLVFAMIHPTGIPAWPGLALIGGMSCFLAYQTKSLVPSMVMHGVWNFATLLATVILFN